MYEIRYSIQFEEWLYKIKERQIILRLTSRLNRLEKFGNFGDYKLLHKGIYELREHFGSGYRMYCIHKTGIIFMLVGGTKRTQNSDIKLAIKMAKFILIIIAKNRFAII